MSDMKPIVQDVLTKLYKQHVTSESIDALEQGQWNASLWQHIVTQQLEDVGLDEMGDFSDVCALHRVSGYYAAPIPFIEHTLSCNVLQAIGANVRDGLHTIATNECIPWGRHAQYVVSVTATHIHIYDALREMFQHGKNIAGEPRDVVTWQHAPLETIALTPAQYDAIRTMMTLSTIFKVTGAVERAVALSLQFSREREQFGRPIHRFQLVQQHIAKLAGEEAVLQAACEAVTADDAFGVGAALIRADEAVQTVTTSAHQLHAAIGVTHEYTLHHATRRLWAWREEGFTVREWTVVLAQQLLADERSLWQQLTD